MKHAISFFDLDHTLLKVNSSFRFGVYLYRQKQFSFSTMIFITSFYWLHLLGVISLQNVQRKIFNQIFLGRPFSGIDTLARSFLEKEFDQMQYSPVVNLLQRAKLEGHYTVILSSSPDFLVRLIAERFAVDEWGATVYSLDHQHFKFISEFMLGHDKARVVSSLAKRFNVSKEKITVYSDSHHDLPFLQMAGTAVGVNPNRKLRALCKQNNWQII